MRAFALAGLLVFICGCGGPTRIDRGRGIFTHDCSGCHTLTGHDTDVSGGDLADARLSVRAIASFVRVMPIRLSPTDVDTVAAYVAAAESSTRH